MITFCTVNLLFSQKRNLPTCDSFLSDGLHLKELTVQNVTQKWQSKQSVLNIVSGTLQGRNVFVQKKYANEAYKCKHLNARIIPLPIILSICSRSLWMYICRIVAFKRSLRGRRAVHHPLSHTKPIQSRNHSLSNFLSRKWHTVMLVQYRRPTWAPQICLLIQAIHIVTCSFCPSSTRF